jgi:erythromycin esterase-like protein
LNTAKASLGNWLHQRHQYNAVLFESSFTLSVIAYLKDDTGSKRLSNFIYPFWNTVSVRGFLQPYFQLERTAHHPLVLGFDPQEDCRFGQLSEFLRDKFISRNKGNMAFADSILSLYIGRNPSKILMSAGEVKLLSALYDNVAAEIEEQQIPERSEAMLVRCFENRKALAHLLSLRTAKEKMYFRDSMMAANILWIKAQILPNVKMLIWSADTHVSRSAGGAPRWMGEWMERDLRFFSVSFRHGSKYSVVKTSGSKFDLEVLVGEKQKVRKEEWNTPCN